MTIEARPPLKGAPSTPFNRRDMLGLCGQTVFAGAALGALATAATAQDRAGPVRTDSLPSPEVLAALDRQWIDPNQQDGKLTQFKLYPQPSRKLPGAPRTDPTPQGSYQIFLPPQYTAEPERRFTVIYWLHDSLGNAHDCEAAVERISNFMAVGKMRPMIIVCPQSLPTGWCVDSRDGARPAEQALVLDLVSHIDSTYRTNANRFGRALEGFSRGGYAALRLGMKYPAVFGKISILSPALRRTLGEEPKALADSTFFGDRDYYAACHPSSLALANCALIRSTQKIRIFQEAKAPPYQAGVLDFHDRLTKLGIPHEYNVLPVEHDYGQLMDKIGDDYFPYWNH